MTMDEAQAVALRALAHLAGDAEGLARFMAMTGIDPADLSARARQGDAALLSAVLQHYLNFEPDLIAFCSTASLKPTLPAIAAEVLSGGRRE